MHVSLWLKKNKKVLMEESKNIYNNFLYETKSQEEKNLMISTHLKLEKQKSNFKKYELKFKNNKYIIGLKYQVVKVKIDFIQISVILVSTIMTFIEALKDILMIPIFVSNILPVICSSYVALILAIARFYKFEDQKESLSKLFEKNAFVINRLKHKIREINEIIPIDPLMDPDTITNFRLNLNSDGLQEVITQSMQETDTAITFREKLYYENMLFKMHLDSMTLKKNLKDLEHYENDLPLNDFKQKVSSFWYYLLCYWSGSNYIINEELAFDSIAKKTNEEEIP